VKTILPADRKNAKRRPKINHDRILGEIVDAGWNKSDRAIAKTVGVSNRTVSQLRKKLEEAGEILPRVKSTDSIAACLHEVCTYVISPAPENDMLYDPVRHDDPSFLALVADIKANNGLINPIGVSRDGFIFDGHRRYAAVKHLGWKKVKVSIHPDVSRRDDLDGFLRRLKSCNAQRVKTTAEVVREGIVGMDDEAWQRVREYRTDASIIDGIEPIILYGEKRRSEIRDKIGLKNAIIKIIEDNRRDWPLSDRKVFYLLLNIKGLLRNDRLRTPFANSDECYNDVTNMATRLRIDETIPFDSIADETRPVVQWNTYRSVDTFIAKELDDLFSDGWRDLLQSQPNWVELLVEKNTVASALNRIAAKYTIPMTSGRGYSSLPPRKGMVDRFKAGGREKLVLIVVSDFDPEGCDIPNSFGVSLRDDFGIEPEKLVIVKAALTQSQIQTLDLHEGQIAKEDSSRYRRFRENYGSRCWELEAVPNEKLREIVEDCIRACLDIEAFERELTIQKKDRAEINEQRLRIKEKIGT
jgi:DNA-binding Lrp family transcriptional regulator